MTTRMPERSRRLDSAPFIWLSEPSRGLLPRRSSVGIACTPDVSCTVTGTSLTLFQTIVMVLLCHSSEDVLCALGVSLVTSYSGVKREQCFFYTHGRVGKSTWIRPPEFK